MASYDYVCGECGAFEVVRPIRTAGSTGALPRLRPVRATGLLAAGADLAGVAAAPAREEADRSA
jgi:hypothetical protein